MGSNHHSSGGGYIPRDGLPILNIGDHLDITKLQNMVQGINRASVVSGEGYQVRRYSNSTVIQPNRYSAGGGLLKNFRVSGFVDENDNGFITVAVGTVNRMVPKINGKYMDDVDEQGLPLKISANNTDGEYVVIECEYSPIHPFPRNSVIKTVSDLESLDNNNTSQFPIARVRYVPPVMSEEDKTPARVEVNQIHIEGNLSVSRVKVGASSIFWQWWTI